MKKRIWLALVCAACLVAGFADAAETFTANTLRLSQGEAPVRATIDAMAWLAGAWSGEGLGGDNEEIWSAPRAGVMMGAYRVFKDEKPAFYELLTLSEIDGSLVLRLKHFDAELRGWEGRNESLTFPLVAQRDGRFYFEGITFEPRGRALTIYLAIGNKEDASVREEIFKYKRAD